jgi:hypothetical protein
MKSTHKLKIVVAEFFRNLEYNFRIFKFQESFAKYKWVIMCMKYEKHCGLWYKKLKLKEGVIYIEKEF